MKISLTAFIVLISIALFGQPLPTKNEQYIFLRWYVKYKKFETLSARTDFIDLYQKPHSKLKNVATQLKLTKKDRAYISRQQTRRKTSLLDTANIPNVRWAYNDSIYYKISMPVFASSKRIALVNWSFSCGYDCGKNGIDAFVLNNGKWKPAKIWAPMLVY